METVTLKPNWERIAVQQEVEKAKSEGTLIEVVLNRQGGLQVITIQPSKSREDDIRQLTEEVAQQGVTFEVCTLIDGQLTRLGDRIALFDLGTAIEEAKAERIRFYTEREEVYGESAWPIRRAQ